MYCRIYSLKGEHVTDVWERSFPCVGVLKMGLSQILIIGGDNTAIALGSLANKILTCAAGGVYVGDLMNDAGVRLLFYISEIVSLVSSSLLRVPH